MNWLFGRNWLERLSGVDARLDRLDRLDAMANKILGKIDLQARREDRLQNMPFQLSSGIGVIRQSLVEMEHRLKPAKRTKRRKRK